MVIWICLDIEQWTHGRSVGCMVGWPWCLDIFRSWCSRKKTGFMNAEKWNIWPSGAVNLAQSVCQKTSGDVPGCLSATDGTMQNSLGRSKTGYQFGYLWMFYDVKNRCLKSYEMFWKMLHVWKVAQPPSPAWLPRFETRRSCKSARRGNGFLFAQLVYNYKWIRLLMVQVSGKKTKNKLENSFMTRCIVR